MSNGNITIKFEISKKRIKELKKSFKNIISTIKKILKEIMHEVKD